MNKKTKEKKEQARNNVISLRLNDMEHGVLNKLAEIEDRSLANTLRVCFMREARLKGIGYQAQ